MSWFTISMTAEQLYNVCQLFAEPRAIAEQGFQFLLLDTYSQLWLLLQQYIASAQNKAGNHFY